MKKTIATLVIEFNGEHNEDTILNTIDFMIAENLDDGETYNVVDIDVIEE